MKDTMFLYAKINVTYPNVDFLSLFCWKVKKQDEVLKNGLE
jgi:hypothetical protein